MKSPEFKKIYFEIIPVLISAILLILSFLPAANLEILAWIALLPLFFALRNKSKGRAFLLSYLCGIIFWLGIIYWLINVTFAGLILLVIYLALYFGLFGLIVSCCPLSTVRYPLFFIPSIWVLLEYLRSHLFTGFGWALLGYSQYLNLPIIQIAGITGVWGVSFLVMMVNALIYSILDTRYAILVKKQKSRLSVVHHLLACLLLFLCLGHGFYKLHRASGIEHRAPLKISVIQGNIPQIIKWKETARDKILKEYLRLSRIAADDNPDLIIWPESALPGILETEPYLKQKLKALVDSIRIPLLLGAVSLGGNNYYNSAILISKQGKFIQRYDKLHLVPFGEYIPLKGTFGFLETVVPIGDFIPGRKYTVFSLESESRGQEAENFSVLICFEDIFPGISRQFVKKGADLLVNITNDAWFGDTSSPYQHLSASVLRAVENGVYLVRAANTGISGFITPQGQIEPLIDNDSGKQTFISGYKTKTIFLEFKQNSFYTRWGDWFIMACGIIVLYCVIRVKVKRPEIWD